MDCLPLSWLSILAGLQRGPQAGNPKNIVGIEWEHKDLGRYIPVGIFLLIFSQFAHESPFTLFADVRL